MQFTATRLKKDIYNKKYFNDTHLLLLFFCYLKQNKIKQDFKKGKKKTPINKRKKTSTSKNRSSISKLWLNWNFSLFCQMSLIKQTGSCFFFFSEKPGNENFHRAAAMREKIKTINFHYYLHTIYIKMHVFSS